MPRTYKLKVADNRLKLSFPLSHDICTPKSLRGRRLDELSQTTDYHQIKICLPRQKRNLNYFFFHIDEQGLQRLGIGGANLDLIPDSPTNYHFIVLSFNFFIC